MTSSRPRAGISIGRRSIRSRTRSSSIFARISGACRSSGWCRAGACSTSTRRSGRSRTGPTRCATRRTSGPRRCTGTDTLAAAALDRLCLIFGASAGDFALAQGAHAVVLAGGLGLRLVDYLPRSGFRDRFIAKGRFERMMDEMPVKVITHPQPGLFGAAAAFAAQRLTGMISSSTLSDRRGLLRLHPRRDRGHGRRADARAHVPDGPAQSFRARRHADRARHDRRNGGRSSAESAIAAYGLLPRNVSELLSAIAGNRRLAAGRRAAVEGALDADGGAGHRPRHRHHEAREPGLHLPGHDRGISASTRRRSRCFPSRRWSERSSGRSSGASSPTSTGARRRSFCRPSCSSGPRSAERCRRSPGTSACAS